MNIFSTTPGSSVIEARRVQKILAALRKGPKDVRPQWEIVDGLAQEGHVAALVELLDGLRDAATEGRAPAWAVQSIAERVEDHLCLSTGWEGAVQALLLGLRSRPAVDPSSRSDHSAKIAARLAQAHGPAILESLFTELSQAPGTEQTFLHLCQEMVLRGYPCLEMPSVARFWEGAKHQAPDLAWLPLRRTEAELSLSLPSFGVSHSGYSWGPEPALQNLRELRRDRLRLSSIPDADAERMRSVVTDWIDHSNGQAETAAFVLEEAAQGALDFLQICVSLPLTCLDGVRLEASQGAEISPSRAFALLFSAAVSGGAYSSSPFGARARLLAWRSAAGLTLCGREAEFEEVCERLMRARWVELRLDTPWFGQIAWDLALAAFLDGRRVTGLFATDED
ncbi:MAG TPA: DUF6183 family protein [Thermoanaerobaculia bacterium]